jgi:hypothetical protein
VSSFITIGYLAHAIFKALHKQMAGWKSHAAAGDGLRRSWFGYFFSLLAEPFLPFLEVW